MTPARPESDDRDPLAAYIDGDPDAVRAVRPPEPSDAAWEAARARIHARLATPAGRPRSGSARRLAFVALGAALSAAAATVLWVGFVHQPVREPEAPVLAVRVVPVIPVAPEPKPAPERPADPLAEYTVLPMAGEDEVVLTRVPGDGWLPVGRHPLPGEVTLASATDVELDDPDSTWGNVTTSPADAAMIYAAKPR
jgi:hypothetical protein